MRKSGIGGIGDVQWGTHVCQFYSTADQLLDALAGYFRAGLESHEYCLWITSPPINRRQALRALEFVLPNARDYLPSGQLDILPHHSWYLLNGAFDANRVHRAWMTRLEWALQSGYTGIRVSGNPTWLANKEEWAQFHAYEGSLSATIGHRAMLALCTYPAQECSDGDVADIVRHHHVAIDQPRRAAKDRPIKSLRSRGTR